MILLTIFLEIILFGLMILFFYLLDESYDHEFLFGGIAVVLLLALFVVPMAIGNLHGYIDYAESNDKDKARITAVTQEQDLLKTYYKIEVEYLDRNFNKQRQIFKGFTAQIIQHEIDQFEGIII